MQNFTQLIYLVLCLACLPAGLSAQTGTFENWNDGHQFTGSNWSNEGFTPAGWGTAYGFDNGRAEVDNAEKKVGSKSLRITYPANVSGVFESGTNFPLNFTSRNEKYMSYWVKFDPEFDWGGDPTRDLEGGKLPGLAGGGLCSGGQNCTGTNGFTARLMWRKAGKAVIYLYHLDKAGSYGDNIELKKADGSTYFFPKGQWVHVAERVKVNTVTNGSANYNGVIEIWINGVKMHSRSNYRFVTNGDKVDNLFFSTFHGGSGSSWAPSRTNYAWFDEVKLGNNYDAVKMAGTSTDGGGGGGTTNTNQWVYRDNVYSGWANWSWGGTATVRDGGVKRRGTHSFKFRSTGGAASLRHNSGFSTNSLQSVRFWARSWNTNFTGRFQARWNDSNGGPNRGFAVTPNWKEYGIGKDRLGTGWIKRMVWRVPSGNSIFIDDVRLVYASSSQGVISQSVDPQISLGETRGLTIFPNPNSGAFTVDFESESDREEVSITLHDLTGRLADQTNVLVTAGANRFYMDYRKSQLPPGVYLMRVTSADGRLNHVKRVSIR